MPACVCVLCSHVWFANQQFLVPVSPLLLFLHLLLPQGSRQEVGSRSEAIVKGKPLASSCYERKCIQMCFLCVRPSLLPRPPYSLSLSSLMADNQPLSLLSSFPSVGPGRISSCFYWRKSDRSDVQSRSLFFSFYYYSICIVIYKHIDMNMHNGEEEVKSTKK